MRFSKSKPSRFRERVLDNYGLQSDSSSKSTEDCCPPHLVSPPGGEGVLGEGGIGRPSCLDSAGASSLCFVSPAQSRVSPALCCLSARAGGVAERANPHNVRLPPGSDPQTFDSDARTNDSDPQTTDSEALTPHSDARRTDSDAQTSGSGARRPIPPAGMAPKCPGGALRGIGMAPKCPGGMLQGSGVEDERVAGVILFAEIWSARSFMSRFGMGGAPPLESATRATAHSKVRSRWFLMPPSAQLGEEQSLTGVFTPPFSPPVPPRSGDRRRCGNPGRPRMRGRRT